MPRSSRRRTGNPQAGTPILLKRSISGRGPGLRIAGATMFLGLALFLFSVPLHAAFYDEEIQVSTEPIGSPFYRHLAQETNIDLRELVKFEKRGFGRTEILTLIYISSATGKPLKDYGKRRLKDKVTLRELASEANLDYDTIHIKAVDVKKRIEFLGSDVLPPPMFEVPKSTGPASPKKKKEKKKKEKAPEQTPSPIPDPLDDKLE